MVLIECKRLPTEEYSKDYDIFVVSLPLETNIGVATDILQKMQNTRVRIKWMVAAAKQLVKDSVTEDQQHHLLGPIHDGEEYLSLERAERRQLCTMEELNTIVDAFKGGVMILFPAECSGADACKNLTAILEDDAASDDMKSKCHRILSLIDDGATNEATLVGDATMWWSSKPLLKEVNFTKYLGKNDKTKITVKLTKSSSEAPPREPALDAKAQADLMRHYYRKQEEMKKLVEDDDISFANSEWANPNGLRKQLMGLDTVSYR